jgi:hypothetical protein
LQHWLCVVDWWCLHTHNPGGGGGRGKQEMREEWGDEGGAGDRGDLSTLTKFTSATRCCKISTETHNLEILEKSLYYLYLSISIGLDR